MYLFSHQDTEDTKRTMDFKPLSKHEEEIAKAIVEAAYIVHKNLGPGLLEKIYEVCFCHELSKMGFHPKRKWICPLFMMEWRLTKDCGLI